MRKLSEMTDEAAFEKLATVMHVTRDQNISHCFILESIRRERLSKHP